MSETEPTLNPYAPTVAIGPDAGVATQDEVEQPIEPSWRRTSLRWLIVCSLSALPSFLYGLSVTGGQIAGMILGILIFVVGYTILDYRTALEPIRRNRRVRRTLRIAYGTRIAISILFPLGAYLDLMCGLVSVKVTQSLSGFDLNGSQPMPFWTTLLTTLVQGVVLNVVLGLYALLVLAVQRIVAALRRG